MLRQVWKKMFCVWRKWCRSSPLFFWRPPVVGLAVIKDTFPPTLWATAQHRHTDSDPQPSLSSQGLSLIIKLVRKARKELTAFRLRSCCSTFEIILYRRISHSETGVASHTHAHTHTLKQTPLNFSSAKLSLITRLENNATRAAYLLKFPHWSCYQTHHELQQRSPQWLTVPETVWSLLTAYSAENNAYSFSTLA